ncbi:hypothetical protein TWF569_001779 [Orbilia oligospora]|uniref:Eukaryotic translation initiation factor 3 subunit D n=1 Tax=Orbilia oligospora TaxID=2813651 RepID=A0A7C8NP87_ORBOL|nr:hypothetical protein TWF103_004927 [Orbilia oligospora]KAF3098433.1 hypothetical protein TWF102_006000 [Orbilia oligospora]KAF3109083.1 hypothetical protein TWF706_001892 [Orbilia oligospora]KAF3120876.1 hypothetical protein TWF594_003498 [Orbilia oligospora]KAF3123301.1 hypothetical protein TWF569_001779 [Orbilia oligospora]
MAPVFNEIITKLATDGAWGPQDPTEAEGTINGMPYNPFSKGDKLGRLADWSGDAKGDRDQRGRGYGRNYRDQQIYGAGASTLFPQLQGEDEASFSLVDNRSNVKPRTPFSRGGGTVFRGRGRGAAGAARGGQRGQQFGRQQAGRQQGDVSRGPRSNRGRRFGWKDYDKPQRNRDSSVVIKPDWKMLEEIDFNRLGKLNLEIDDGEDVESYGSLFYYNRSFDRSATKATSTPLVIFDRAWYNPTTSGDPVIQKLADGEKATIFATDTVLSTLMCATRSVYSWDIVINRVGNKLYFDKRDGSQIDFATVNENAADPPMDVNESSKENINSPGRLALEATVLNANFAVQAVIEDTEHEHKFEHEDPFYTPAPGEPELARKGYKYRRFDLSLSDDQPLHLIVRTEIDAVMKNPASGQNNLVTIKALNEFDERAQGSGGAMSWRNKLHTSRGAIVATEMKNNSCKLAKWTTQAILAKTDFMRIGFISRVNPKEREKHVVLGVVGYKPREFANQMNLSLSNGWGIVRTIIDMCMAMPEGKYILVKDPNKQVIRLYEVPPTSFEEDGEGEAAIEEEAEE